MPPEAIFDISQVDLTRVIATREEIEQYNPQRYEMQQVDAIVYFDATARIVVGYKDLKPDEFWIRGHMPGYPLMPGVMMCEAAAQLCSYFVLKSNLLKGDFIGFMGLEGFRFRGVVRPGDRLILVGRVNRLHPRQTTFGVQGYVGTTMVFNGEVLGVPMIRQ